MDKVWMMPPFGEGEPKEVDATPEVLVPLMNTGWTQCDPPAAPATRSTQEVKTHVHD